MTTRYGAGARDKRVVIEVPADPPQTNEFGEVVEKFNPIGTRSASVAPLEGSEYFDAQQTQSAANRRLVFLYDSVTKQITTKTRLRMGAHEFDVEDVQNPDFRNAEIHVIARELV